MDTGTSCECPTDGAPSTPPANDGAATIGDAGAPSSSSSEPPDELAARRARLRHAAERRKRAEWIFLALAIALIVALGWGE